MMSEKGFEKNYYKMYHYITTGINSSGINPFPTMGNKNMAIIFGNLVGSQTHYVKMELPAANLCLL